MPTACPQKLQHIGRTGSSHSGIVRELQQCSHLEQSARGVLRDKKMSARDAKLTLTHSVQLVHGEDHAKNTPWPPHIHFHWWQARICNLRFADDTNLIGGSNAELQDLTNRLVDTARAYESRMSGKLLNLTTRLRLSILKLWTLVAWIGLTPCCLRKGTGGTGISGSCLWGGGGGEERDIPYATLSSQCIMMGSDVCRLCNVSCQSGGMGRKRRGWDKVIGQCPQLRLWRERRAEADSSRCPPA